MSETTEKTEITEITEITLPFMTETDIARLSVSALSNRPGERSGQYGRKGLTPEEIKEAFSALPVAIASRMNEILPLLIGKLSETDLSFKEVGIAINDVMRALDVKLDKLQRPDGGSAATLYLYGEGEAGDTVLFKGNVFAEGGTLVYRDSKGTFTVSAPSSPGNPITKQYFENKSKNSLYPQVMDTERRVQALEHAANGSLYETKKMKGKAAVIQVDNACPYGILSRIGGNVAQINVGLPFEINGATAFRNYGECKVKGNTLIFCKGGTYGVQIPCNIAAGTSVTVAAKSTANDSRDTITDYIFLSESGAAVSDQKHLNQEATLKEASKYLLLYKENKTVGLYGDLEISDIRVTFSDPSDGALLRVIDTVGIPAEICSGDAEAYLDLTERKLYGSDGTVTDVSQQLFDEFDLLSLLPSAIVEFKDSSGDRVLADYELSYKNKI